MYIYIAIYDTYVFYIFVCSFVVGVMSNDFADLIDADVDLRWLTRFKIGRKFRYNSDVQKRIIKNLTMAENTCDYFEPFFEFWPKKWRRYGVNEWINRRIKRGNTDGKPSVKNIFAIKSQDNTPRQDPFHREVAVANINHWYHSNLHLYLRRKNSF